MSVLCGASIKRNISITPFVDAKTQWQYNDWPALSYGLSEAGYDIRLSEEHVSSDTCIVKGNMVLAVSMERLVIPNNVIAFVHDKSTLARRGLAMQNTVLEPGWEGHITLEITYHGAAYQFQLHRGMPIAQVCFHWLDGPATSYEGRYQDQPEKPVEAL